VSANTSGSAVTPYTGKNMVSEKKILKKVSFS